MMANNASKGSREAWTLSAHVSHTSAVPELQCVVMFGESSGGCTLRVRIHESRPFSNARFDTSGSYLALPPNKNLAPFQEPSHGTSRANVVSNAAIDSVWCTQTETSTVTAMALFGALACQVAAPLETRNSREPGRVERGVGTDECRRRDQDVHQITDSEIGLSII